MNPVAVADAEDEEVFVPVMVVWAPRELAVGDVVEAEVVAAAELLE